MEICAGVDAHAEHKLSAKNKNRETMIYGWNRY
jgi:hypothetical protein